MSRRKDEDCYRCGDMIFVNEFNNLFEEMAEKYQEVTGSQYKFEKWKVGNYCRVLYSDGLYYEGKIVWIKKGTFRVQYLGYDDWEDFYCSDLQDSLGELERREQMKEAAALNSEQKNDDKTRKAAGNPSSKRGSKIDPFKEDLLPRETCTPPPVTCDFMPNIRLPEIPKAHFNDPLMISMLNSWFMSGFYSGLYVGKANKDASAKREPDDCEKAKFCDHCACSKNK